MLRFLGVDEATISNRIAAAAEIATPGGSLAFERGPRPTARIANYADVRAALSHTRYRRWLAA